MASSASFLDKKNVTWANVPSYLKLSSIWTEYFEGSALYIFSAKTWKISIVGQQVDNWPQQNTIWLLAPRYDVIKLFW